MHTFFKASLSSFRLSEHPLLIPTALLWALTIGMAYHHCAILGLPFLEEQPLHIMPGTIALAVTVVPAYLDLCTR